MPVPEYSKSEATGQYSHIQELNQIPQIAYASSNAVDKPVQESQDFIPPQATGTVIIPRRPPPAIPVDTVGLNVPGKGGAVFLGSGSLGVLDLGGGAYALGSGSIGYSDRRSNPRSSFKAPLLPPVRATPNLIPAAVNSPLPPQQTPIFEYQFPVTGQLPTDQNGYEYLPPNRVGFGDPLPMRPLKTRNAYATPSPLQLPPQEPVYSSFDPSQLMQQPQPVQPEFIQTTHILQTTESVTPKDANRADIYGQDIIDLYSSSYLK
nr:actin cytoskeleton-regulatory complex protein PAN1-like [Leptinotarsa decemlineata]